MEQQEGQKQNDISDTPDESQGSGVRGAESRRLYTTAQNVASGPISRPAGKVRKKSSGGRESKRRKSEQASQPVISEQSLRTNSSGSNTSSHPGSSSATATNSHSQQSYQRPRYHVERAQVITKEHHIRRMCSGLDMKQANPLSLVLCPVTSSTSASASAAPNNSNNNASAFRLALCPSAQSSAQKPSLSTSDVTLGFVTGDNFESWLKSIKSEAGYGELDAVAYTKDGRPYVNRLTLSKAGSDEKVCLAMLQEFRTALSNPPRAITDSTNSSNQSNSDFNNSSSNDTDTSSSSSIKRDPKNPYAGSNSGSDSAVNDNDIVDFIAASSGESEQSERSTTPQEENSEENNSKSDGDHDEDDGVPITDNDVVNFLAEEADDDDEEDDMKPTTSATAISSKPTSTATAASTTTVENRNTQQPQTIDPYLVTARIDLETAWRAAWASSFGSNELVQRSTSTYSLTSVGNNDLSSNSESSSTKGVAEGEKAKANDRSPSKDNLGSVETFMKFMKDSDQAFVLLSPLGLIMSSNAAFTNLTGYKLVDVEQKKISEVLGGAGTDEETEQVMWQKPCIVVDGKVSPTTVKSKISTVTTLLHYDQANVAFLNGLRAYKIGTGTSCYWAVSMENRSKLSSKASEKTKKRRTRAAAGEEGIKILAEVILVSL
ncbi:hypothetical protein TrST_g1730 [Triparma strigata]|uniref:PAS domain-containing protein n=1 Tax=Triparma strigata TaxID=1606541 RepID=A0A9W7BPT8_9STRA|nr:hypothetical protein TrST_g1730 [Triparma strigata]